MSGPIVLAFSGGLDTSWCVPWLKENRKSDVVTVTVDVGGLDEAEREGLRKRSEDLGAARHVVVDARARFFDEVLKFLVMGNVRRGGLYPLCVGAERTLQAAEVAKAARDLGASTVVHGCTAAGNDQVRFEIALRALAPELEILAPIRDLAPSRLEEVAFLEERGISVPPSAGDYSINAGLWGVTIGGRETHGTDESLPESAWERTRGAFDNPKEASAHSIRFEAGVPVALDGQEMDAVSLIEATDALAASYGIGRGIHLGDTILGNKGRVAFEAPAAEVLLAAHRELEKLVLSAEQMRLKDQLAQSYGDLVHEGRLLERACRDIEAFLTSSQADVSGEVRVLLRPGSVFVEGASATASLHSASRSRYGEEASEWTPADAAGYSKLLALPLILQQRAGESS